MTVECLKNALALIENYFGRPLSTDERTARSQIYAAALKDIPDDVAAAALTKALTVCRYQNQLLVDWCAEIRKLQSAGQPTANDLWTQAIVAARKIERNQYYATHGGLVTGHREADRRGLPGREQEHLRCLACRCAGMGWLPGGAGGCP